MLKILGALHFIFPLKKTFNFNSSSFSSLIYYYHAFIMFNCVLQICIMLTTNCQK